MAQNKLIIISENVKNLREAIGLSQHDFSLIIGLSKRSIANIESGEHDFKIKILYKILSFFNLDFENISNDKLKITDDLREITIKEHKKINTDKIEILSKRPTIVYAIKYKLLKSDFLNDPREINEIRTLFKKWGWVYPSSSITNALMRMPQQIQIRKHESKGNTNIYLKK